MAQRLSSKARIAVWNRTDAEKSRGRYFLGNFFSILVNIHLLMVTGMLCSRSCCSIAYRVSVEGVF